ncbi:MAG: CPBP family intramembrane metalloprotease [Roseovarius sp.]|nr:CPBP family intramembrane metalloprotease [Roseovarius sp.]MCY4292302.1 CPBP family intramembrane metalloprotease [Roseovarius sp.]MCY4316320.1 CPBP family intramembrane metalloprotease [Roseovarius sp.]
MAEDKSVSMPRNSRLWFEASLLYVAAPVVMAVFLPANWLFLMLFIVMAIGLILLWRTPGVRLSDLLRGFGRIDWKTTCVFTAVTAIICYMVVMAYEPDSAFRLLRENPPLLLIIAILYPILSALPQEIIYRPLFFHRYGGLISSANQAVFVNAALFSLAHLMYWNLVVAAMTFCGGLIFAGVYSKTGNFPMVVLLHAIAGNLIFAFGLGIYFYSDMVVRPF